MASHTSSSAKCMLALMRLTAGRYVSLDQTQDLAYGHEGQCRVVSWNRRPHDQASRGWPHSAVAIGSAAIAWRFSSPVPGSIRMANLVQQRRSWPKRAWRAYSCISSLLTSETSPLASPGISTADRPQALLRKRSHQCAGILYSSK